MRSERVPDLKFPCPLHTLPSVLVLSQFQCQDYLLEIQFINIKFIDVLNYGHKIELNL